MRSAVEIGYGLLQQGRYTEALPFLQRAVFEQPREARVHLYLALAYAHSGENAQAERHFAQAIALNPHDAYVFYNWGAYLHRQSRLPDALNAYETAYRLNPTLVGAKQAADSLRGGAHPSAASLQPSSVAAPSAYTANAPPPLTPADLYMPASRRYRNARGCIVAGVLVSMLGLCAPPIGMLGGVFCGVIALLRGSIAGGLVVMGLAVVLGFIGRWIWQMLYEMLRSTVPM
ncbi:MAG: hypothetical protein KatS3mg019_1736 [Fimbriimonadales bacterium]|nr:MAG: hypothetical protein KatS3mg019_1736 [Fimbriimonadales bacterium]